MSVADILANGVTIANRWADVAIVWHAVLALLLMVIFRRLVGRAVVAAICVSLFVSVAAFAFAAANPFNGVVFIIAGATLSRTVWHMPRAPVNVAATPMMTAGLLLAGFAWIYPHFLDARPWTAYLYAAPLGLLPCPTLAAVAGVTLICSGFNSRMWSGTMAFLAWSYGAVGVWLLGVTIDLALIAGALVLMGVTVIPMPLTAAPRARASPRPTHPVGVANR